MQEKKLVCKQQKGRKDYAPLIWKNRGNKSRLFVCSKCYRRGHAPIQRRMNLPKSPLRGEKGSSPQQLFLQLGKVIIQLFKLFNYSTTTTGRFAGAGSCAHCAGPPRCGVGVGAHRERDAGQQGKSRRPPSFKVGYGMRAASNTGAPQLQHHFTGNLGYNAELGVI